jgi:hypothetical protein
VFKVEEEVAKGGKARLLRKQGPSNKLLGDCRWKPKDSRRILPWPVPTLVYSTVPEVHEISRYTPQTQSRLKDPVAPLDDAQSRD